MKPLSLLQALDIKSSRIISFYGAGGKTTLLYSLASEMISAGKKVLITTTTKMYFPTGITLFTDRNIDEALPAIADHFKYNAEAFLGSELVSGNKIKGIDKDSLNLLLKIPDLTILVEADGAKGFPLKGYRVDEPAIPPCSDLIIPVIGADALGRSLDAGSVHCIKELLQATNIPAGKIIDEQVLSEIYLMMLSMGLAQAKNARVDLILNKCDLLSNFGNSAAVLLSALNRNIDRTGCLLLTEAKNSNPVKGIFPLLKRSHSPEVSAVILAAGKSSRMGQDKLKMPVEGETMLEITLKRVIEAGVEDIIVVAKPGSEWFKSLEGYPCRVVESPDYSTGMAESLKAGLNSVSARSQAVLFVLADQPFVPRSVYELLINSYRSSLKLATCPVYRRQRGNPVIFDRRTWPDLFKITGDQGGKSVIEQLPAEELNLVPTESSEILQDIDTPADYNTAVKNENSFN